MQSSDVIIVGGGPAGSTCARELTRCGMQVTLLDRAVFPRNKICAGWVTPGVFELLGIEPEQYGSNCTLTPVNGFKVGLIGGRGVKVNYPGTVSYGIRRCEFDDYLLKRCGAEIIENCHVKSIEKQPSGWYVNGSYSAPMLVGAAGFACPVARFVNAGESREEIAVTTKEIEFPLEAEQVKQVKLARGVPELYFCRDLKGYGWCFLKHGYLNVGIGREDKRGLGTHLREFVAWLETSERIPKNLLDKLPGHAYLIYGHSPRKIVDQGVLLAGDSAGLAYPKSGEGIQPAIASGMAAARIIADAQGNYSREYLTRYETELEHLYGRREPDRMRLPQWLTVTAGRWLLGTTWFCKHFVLDRWFLHRVPEHHSRVS